MISRRPYTKNYESTPWRRSDDATAGEIPSAERTLPFDRGLSLCQDWRAGRRQLGLAAGTAHARA